MKTPVLVTALFDINRDSWDNYRMSLNTYMAWMKNTLAIDASIVVFTENRIGNMLWPFIAEIGAQDRVHFVYQNVPELTAYRTFGHHLERLMGSSEFKAKVSFQVPEMTRPLYNVLMFNKVRWLQEARSWIKGDCYIWMDAGGLRENVAEYRGVKWPSLAVLANLPQRQVTVFCHHEHVRIHNDQDHALSQMRYIQGTAFVCPEGLIDQLAELFDGQVRSCLSQGYIGSDEKVFDLVYKANPHLFNLIVCGWREYFKLLK